MVLSPFIYWQKLLWTFCLSLLFVSCSKGERVWEECVFSTPTPEYSGVSFFLCSEKELAPVELEITRTCSGVRFYINLLSYVAKSCEGDPFRTCVSIAVDDETPWEVFPYILEGGQRLLFPGDVTAILIQWLGEGRNLTFTLGRFQITTSTTNFPKVLCDLSSGT